MHAKEITHHVGERSVVLKQIQDNRGSATGSLVWSASIALSRYIQRYMTKARISGRTIVELGAGLGLVSITCALLGGRVVSTDGDEHVLPTLRENIESSTSDAIESNKTSTAIHKPTVELYKWGERFGSGGNGAEERRTFDVIMAADVIYTPSTFTPLLQGVFFSVLLSFFFSGTCVNVK
jgi:predicted nicotinamide N-methyase